jgi:hypothetical protein
MAPSEDRRLNEKIDRILFILENDEKTGRKGLVQMVALIRIDLDGLLKREEIAAAVHRGKSAIYGGIGALILWIIGTVLKLLFPFLLKIL